jgi:hypothetical protein
MKDPTSNTPSLTPARDRSAVPAPVWLVLAFREAAEASMPRAEPSEEALEVELLVIAAEAAFRSLSTFEDFVLGLERGGDPDFRLEPYVIEEGYHSWLLAADALAERVENLQRHAYESKSFERFLKAREAALDFVKQATLRRRIERRALRRDELAALASRLKPTEVSRTAGGTMG